MRFGSSDTRDKNAYYAPKKKKKKTPINISVSCITAWMYMATLMLVFPFLFCLWGFMISKHDEKDWPQKSWMEIPQAYILFRLKISLSFMAKFSILDTVKL